MDLGHLGLPPEAIIDDVDIEYDRPLGAGADAVVYPGTWRAPVAVKTLHQLLVEPGNDGREVFMQRFGQECVRLRDLRHENVVEFMGVCRSRDGAPALVTERMDTTLKDRYTTGMTVDEQLAVFTDIASGLAYIHKEGLVHRDLTTRNVLLNRHRHAKISDVGVARSLHGDDVMAGGLTRCPGTILYMPPEALRNPPEYDDSLDCFAFGVLMMAVIARREPDASLLLAERHERLADGTRREIPELHRRAADFDAVPEAHPARELIARCLSNERDLRPRAAELHDELLDKLNTNRPAQRRRHRDEVGCECCCPDRIRKRFHR